MREKKAMALHVASGLSLASSAATHGAEPPIAMTAQARIRDQPLWLGTGLGTSIVVLKP